MVLEADWCLGVEREVMGGRTFWELVGPLGKGRGPKIEASGSQSGVRGVSRLLARILGSMCCDVISVCSVCGI